MQVGQDADSGHRDQCHAPFSRVQLSDIAGDLRAYLWRKVKQAVHGMPTRAGNIVNDQPAADAQIEDGSTVLNP